MLEIKPYEDWSTGSKEQDPVEKLKGYTDYVRSGYFKAGALTPRVEQEIQAGAVQRLQMDGLINDETSDEDKENTFKRVLSPREDSDANARFVLDHLRNDYASKDPRVNGTNVDTLSKYLSLKQTVPAEATALQGSVDEILKDKELIKRARISAVDRGDFDVVAVDSESGRQLYSSPNAKSENVRGSVDTLLKSGAISTFDLNDVADLTKSVNGGLTTNARLSSYAQFDNAVSSIAKGDKDIGDTINTSASALTEAKRKAQLSTGEAILEGAKTVVAYPFDLLGKGVMLAKDAITGDLKEEKPAKYTDLYQALSQNKAFSDKYTPEDLKSFSEDYVTRRAAPAFDADKPETGITTDSMGNPLIAAALLPRKDLFEKALAASSLNEEQKQAAQVERDQNLQANTPELKKLILGESSDAVSAYAKAKAAGQSDSDFVESWVSNDKNYDGFNTRLKQFGMSAFKTVAELPLGIAALAGNEGAAKALGALNKDQADRQEYSRLFGDEYGIGFQLINAVPQVGTDIAATIGTAGAFAGIRSLAKGGAIAGVEIAEAAAKTGAEVGVKLGANASTKTILRSTAMSAVSNLDEAGVAAGKAALAEGGEAVVGDSFKQLGVSLAEKFGKAAELTPVFATSFLRSASSSYGSVYNQLPEDLSHKEKHEKAFGYAVGSGLSTAVITAGMSFLGRGGVEDLATSRVRGILAGESEEALVAAGKKSIPLGELNYKQAKLLYESVSNEGRYVKDKVFQNAMTEAIGGSYKKFIKGSLNGFSNEAFEETLDQAIQMRVEDAALDKTTPLVERVNQLWDAGIVGGLLGGASTVVEAITPISKSDRTMALAARSSALESIATRLSDSKSPATSEIVQRIMDDAKAEYNLSLKQDQEAQKSLEENPAKTTMGNDLSIKPVKFDSEGQGLLDLGDEPKKTQFLGDFVGTRATVSGYTGTLELDENGAVRLAFDNVHDDGVSHMTVGPRFMPLDKSTASLERNTLSSLSVDSGTIKAGTPIIVPDTSSKEQYAFPESSDNVSSIKIGDVDAIIVKGTRLVGNENTTRDIVITDPDQIQDTLSHYKLDLKSLEPKQGNVQLDLDLFRAGKYGQVEESGKYTGDFNRPSTVTEVPDTGKYAETEDSGRYKAEPDQKAESGTVEAKALPVVDKDPRSPTALVQTMIGDNQLLGSYIAIADNKFQSEEIRDLVGRTTPEEIKELDSHIRDVSAFARGLGDEYSDEKAKILSSLSSLKTIHDQIKVAFILPKPTAAPVVETAPVVEATPEGAAAPVVQSSGRYANAQKPSGRYANAPVEESAVEPEVAVSTETPAATKRDKAAVVPEIEDSGKRLLAAAQERADLQDATVATGIDGKPATIETVEQQLSSINDRLAALRQSDVAIPVELLTRFDKLRTGLEAAKIEFEKQDTKLGSEIDKLTAVDPTAETQETRNKDNLLAIITGAKSAPVEAIEAAAKVTEPTSSFEHPKHGFFRNETESNTFTGLAEGGFLISDWASYGFTSGKVNGVSLNGSREKGMPAHQVELKQRLLAAVQEQFPFVDPPASGVEYRKSEAPVGRMDASGSAYLNLPFLADKEGNITQGFFTNNPQITAAQLDKGKEVFVPKKILKDESFRANPSILINESTGQVTGVLRNPNDTGVYGAGDVSMVGTTGYTQRGLTKVADLGAMLVEPAAVHLDGVGPSARNVSDTNSTYQTLMNDAVAAGEIYTDRPLGEDTKDEKQSRYSKTGYLLLKNMNLTEDFAEQAIRTAQIKYSHAVKEYGLATLIDRKLEKLRETNPSATIDDLPLSKIVLQNSSDSQTKRTPNKTDLAAVLKANGFDGGSPEGVIANYGRYLYESKGNETYAKGAPSFKTFVIKEGANAQDAQRRRFTVETKNKSFSIDAASMDASESKSAFAALSNLIDQNEDVRATVIRSEESALDELVGTIEDNDGAYELLYGIVRRSAGLDLNPNISAEDLVDLASRSLASSDAIAKKKIAKDLSTSTEGMALANKLLKAGWLPAVGTGGSPVAPSRSRAVTPEQRAAVMVEPESQEAIRANIVAVRRLAQTNRDVQLSVSDDVTLLANEARKMNTAEADRLGIRSGDTESVVVAIQQLAESGKAQHKRVAALLSQFPELIRNVNFQIMDFNDVRFAGAFMPKSNLVVVNISGHNGRGLADVILHEFLHAATFQIMNDPRTPMQVKAMERIKALRALTEVQAGKLGMSSNQFESAFSSDTEFLAYALTDVKFQGLITAATPTGQRSLFSRIVDAILGLFGVDKADKKLSGPLEELIDFAGMFANDSTYNIKYRSKIYADATQLASSISELAGVLKASGKLRSSSKALFSETEDDMMDLHGPYIGDISSKIPDRDGWLSKSGAFIENSFAGVNLGSSSFGGHEGTAIGILSGKHTEDLKSLTKGKPIETLSSDQIYNAMYGLGYSRIVGESGYTIYVAGPVTRAQLSALRDMAIETGTEVIHDRGPQLMQRTLFSPKDSMAPRVEEVSGGTDVDVQEEFNKHLPEGIVAVADTNLAGTAAVNRNSDTIKFNPYHLADRVAGMTKRGAKASLRSLVDHEVGHIAVAKEFTPEQVTQVATELGNDKLQAVAEEYYSTTGLTEQQIRERVAADRQSGKLTDSDIADEWLRMMVTKAATGSTYEEDIRFALKNPTLLNSVVRAIKAFVNQIRQRFAEYPTAETAAMISRAERNFRNIQKGMGVGIDANILEGNSFGDTGSLFAALDGAPEGDRTMYSVPVLSSAPKKVDDMLYRLKMYNLPSELRDVVNNRMGTINTIASSIKDFIRDFPKMRDAALNAGVSMDGIQTLFGTTAPPLTDAVLKDINNKAGIFETTLDPTLTEGQVLDQVDGYKEGLKREARLRFNEQFRVKQQAAERSVTDAGFGGLVKKAVALRSDINDHKETIGFDESNDVYLTRAYKFFTTEGWALATKQGGKITVDGTVVDFDKLRSVAAEAYQEQAEAYLNATGKPFTQEDVAQRTLGMLDQYLSTLETASKAVDKVVIDSLRKDLNRFKPKKDIDSTFRALLGEIEDPLANAANTLFRVGMLSANDQFKTNFAKTAIDLGLASKEAKPDFIKWKSDSSSPTMGSMAGLYFDPKVVGVLDEVFGANMAKHESNSSKLMTNLSSVASRLSGLAVLSKTQLGIGYWPRNAIGGYIMGAAQGIYWNPLSAKGRDSVTQSTRAAFDRLPTEKDQRGALQRLIQLNVLNDQSQGRVVQDMIRGMIGTPEGELQELMADIEEARATKDAGGVLARMKQKGKFKGIYDLAGSKFTKATEVLGALDGMIDGIWKTNAYYFELNEINKHFGETMTDSAKEEAAARKVKLTFAGHSQVIDPVKSFNRTPMANLFLPFARWKSEVFRTMANTIPLAMEEIGQGGSMARRGVRRLAGFTSTLAAAPVVIGTLATTLFRALSGDDEEGEDARVLSVTERSALNEALPAWQRTHNLFSQVLGGNKIQVVDMSYILPHSQLTDAVTIISDGLRTGKGIEGSKLAGYVVNDLIGAQIAATSISQVLSNKDAMDQPIYVETDSAPTKMMRLLTHYGKAAVVPSAVSKVQDTFRTGQQNTKDMVIGELIGARPKTYTFGEIERRGFKNLKSAQDTAVSTIGALSSSRYMSQDDIDETIDRHQDAMNQTQARVSKFMRTMKDLGSPESSIAASAKQASFSSDTIQSAYAGYRIAWKPNQEWANKAYANAKQSGEQDPQEKLGMVVNKIKTKPDIYWVNDPVE